MSIYDHIAPFYDADMGASMRLPDIAYYLDHARRAGGPVLELGCGSARVLAALLTAGVDAVGLDRSLPMLHEARRRCGTGARLLCGDLRRLPLRGDFALALLPYSLVTYLLEDTDWAALGVGLRGALRPGGRVLIDAFIPQAALPGAGWLRDYARRVDGALLVRHKRIARLADGSHRIERRYRQRGAFGGRSLVTVEHIRPYAPETLLALATRHLGPALQIDYDYQSGHPSEGARFCSIVCGLRPQAAGDVPLRI